MIHERYPIDESRLGVDPTYEPYLEEGYIEESYVGKIELIDIGVCDVILFSGEENCTPHFHIVNEAYTMEICVCIFSNEYYSHNGQSTLTLSNENKKRLDEWLHTDSTIAPHIIKQSRWEDVKFAWKINNTLGEWPNMRIQPDYATMTNFHN